MKSNKERIRNGISFFRNLASLNYDSIQVKKYLPKFLDLVEEYINAGEVKEPYLYETAQQIFKV